MVPRPPWLGPLPRSTPNFAFSSPGPQQGRCNGLGARPRQGTEGLWSLRRKTGPARPLISFRQISSAPNEPDMAEAAPPSAVAPTPGLTRHPAIQEPLWDAPSSTRHTINTYLSLSPPSRLSPGARNTHSVPSRASKALPLRSQGASGERGLGPHNRTI